MPDSPAVSKNKAGAPAVKSERAWQPMISLREEMDRLFDNFWRGFGTDWPARAGSSGMPRVLPVSVGMAVPAIDVAENEKEYRIVAELPGIETTDVDVSVSGDSLIISGEKKEERDHKAENYFLSERSFGSFRRSLPLPPDVDRGKIGAAFGKGVLTVTLPKTGEAAQQQRKIEVKPAGS